MTGTKINLFTSDPPVKEFGIRIPVLFNLGKQVLNTKENILNYKGYFPFAKSAPHISIASLLTSIENSKKIKEALSYLKNTDRFTLNVREVTYSSHTDKNGFHTAFLSIDYSNEFNTIQKKLKAMLSHFISSRYSIYPKPHITITKYSRDQVEKIQKLLSSFTFEKDYHVTEVELLQRSPGEGWDWSNRYTVKLK